MATLKGAYLKFNFKVEMDGLVQANFSEVTGLSAEANVADYRDGSAKTGHGKLPGIHKAEHVTLKHGIIGTQSFYDWLEKCSTGKIKECKRNLVITLSRDDRKAPPVRWKLMGTMPIKWSVPDLKADANEVAIEDLVLSAEWVAQEGE